MKHENKVFTSQSVNLDGNQFINCQFINCQLVYKGTADIQLSGCSFTKPQFVFDGASAGTIKLLHALYQMPGGREFVENVFNQIRSGGIKEI